MAPIRAPHWNAPFDVLGERDQLLDQLRGRYGVVLIKLMADWSRSVNARCCTTLAFAAFASMKAMRGDRPMLGILGPY